MLVFLDVIPHETILKPDRLSLSQRRITKSGIVGYGKPGAALFTYDHRHYKHIGCALAITIAGQALSHAVGGPLAFSLKRRQHRDFSCC